MPQPYLVSHLFMVPIQLSKHYQNRWQVMDGELYIDLQATAITVKPTNAPPSCNAAYRIQDEILFHNFLTSWMDGSLVLYRGFPGCHFCWPDLLMGQLKSEGDEDKPEFTMSDSGKGTTRWLPTASRDLARGVSLQCCDQFTRGLALHEHIPIGFTVKIPAGSSKKLSVCWLNSGEIVVRGPLISGQYQMESITWLRNGITSYTMWPLEFPNLFLPPQRPYKPSAIAVYEWWDTCQIWKAEAKRLEPTIQ